jgi:hypothetical protein
VIGWLMIIGLALMALIVQAQKSRKAGVGESQRRLGRHFAAFAASQGRPHQASSVMALAPTR